MKAEKPALGIMRTHDFGNSVFYDVACSCGNEDDTISFEVEAEDNQVTVHTWTKKKTDYWNNRFEKKYDIENEFLQHLHWAWVDFFNGTWARVKLTWNVWINGYLEYHSYTLMTKQQALNYAEILKDSIVQVEKFEAERLANHPTPSQKLREENKALKAEIERLKWAATEHD